MKSKFLTVLFCLAFLSLAQAADVDCSIANGKIHYKETGYNKGMPPRPGDLLRTVQIFADGELVSESKFYKNLNPELGPIVATLDSEVEINTSSDRMGSVRDYVVRLKLEKNRIDISEPAIDLPFSDYAICKRSFYPVP
jgi:hypothetical protein